MPRRRPPTRARTTPADRGPARQPVRTCVGCRTARPAGELVRCALGPDGRPRVSRTAPGRGAWLCAGSLECFDGAVRRRGFDRAWRQQVDRAVLDDLRGDFQVTAGRMGQSWVAGRVGAPAAATKD